MSIPRTNEAVRKLNDIGIDFINTVTSGAYIPFAERDKAYKGAVSELGTISANH
jgi:hypothetical protein